MSKISEFFTFGTSTETIDWISIISTQHCAYLGKKCIKNRKSQAGIAIGTCTVKYGKDETNVIICPQRLLQNQKIFIDCIHLLTLHEPGNDLHIVPEVNIPGAAWTIFWSLSRMEK